jgi:uncharacterized protein
MLRFSFKKLIPSTEAIKCSKSLRFLGNLIHDPNLFLLNRRSVSVALFWGILIGLLPPIPIHTPAAAVVALLARCNLPLLIATVWIGNPITYPIIMYEFYRLGLLILHTEPVASLEFSWSWLTHQFILIWKPYLVGSIVGSLTFATAGYFISNYAWRLNVKRKWHARQKNRIELRSVKSQ